LPFAGARRLAVFGRADRAVDRDEPRVSSLEPPSGFAGAYDGVQLQDLPSIDQSDVEALAPAADVDAGPRTRALA
jgi:hypothetical protein